MKWANGIDLRPSVPLLCLGLVIGVGIVCWVWLRGAYDENRQVRLRRLCALTLFLCFDLVLFGSFTRLSDSGLGCPDWPGCYGFASPMGAGVDIAAAEQLMPQGPVSMSKAWIEMIHRYAAMTVGFLILILFVETWRHGIKQLRSPVAHEPWRAALWCSSLSMFWVILQGVFGALTVTSKLFPAIVSLHLLGGMVLLALLVTQWFAYGGRPHAMLEKSAMDKAIAHSGQWRLGTWLMAGACVLLIQLALGAWVSTNYAVLACQTFPMCQEAWWPEMNFTQGFELWRPLGQTAQQEPLVFQALTAIHYVHRLMAYAVFGVLGVVSIRMFKSGYKWLGLAMSALLLLQFFSGLSNVVMGWPIIGAILHVAGASGLVIALTWGALQFFQDQSAARSRLPKDFTV
ncbi:MAG: COX15/CtaA family protein [Betaproteobacteria bacterium]